MKFSDYVEITGGTGMLKKKVLVIGGAGFIGSHLVPYLLSSDMDVRVLDTLSPQIHGHIPNGLDWLNNPSIEFLRGSVNDSKILTAALADVDFIVHLASETGTGQSMYDIGHYNQVNSQGTALLLDLLVNTTNHKVARVVLASSRSVYGEGAYVCLECSPLQRAYPSARTHDQLAEHRWEPYCSKCGATLTVVPTCETDLVQPASIYAATKYAQEDLVRIACSSSGIDYAILRLQNVYGERQSLNNPYTGILSIFSTRIRRGLDLPIFEDGLESRDFVHVDDVARAMHACLIHDTPIKRVINVGSGVATSVMDVARQLVISLGGNVPLRVTSEYRVGDIRHNVADVSRLNELLLGGAQIGLAEGLDRFAAWVKTQPLPEDKLDKANAELRERKLMA